MSKEEEPVFKKEIYKGKKISYFAKFDTNYPKKMLSYFAKFDTNYLKKMLTSSGIDNKTKEAIKHLFKQKR